LCYRPGMRTGYRRISIVAGLAAITVALLAACERSANEEPQTNVVENQVAAEPPPLVLREPPIDRETLLLAMVRAASAYAAGADDRADQRMLDGKQFELRIRFGCTPDDDAEQPFGLHLNEQRRTVRLRASPNLTSDEPLLLDVGEEGVETVEGFWLPRPWMLIAACPAIRPAATSEDEGSGEDTAVSEPSASTERPARQAGIAQFFTEQDSRTLRRGRRPYEATEVLEAEESPSAQGYDFVLAGRFRRLTDGRVIACASPSPALEPTCIASAEFGRAWIERADNKSIVAQWGGG
jgi:hypothetical protein